MSNSGGSARRPTITKLSSAFPPHRLSQKDLYDGLMKEWYKDIPGAWELMEQTKVQYRNMAWDPRQALLRGSPSTDERMEIYKKVVLEVSGRTIKSVLSGESDHFVGKGRDTAFAGPSVGSFVMASCTGYMGPTPDLMLAREFKLRPDLRRTFVGHMGCFAAFNVLKVAMDSLAARQDEKVLANCTEFCSLHFRPERTQEQAVIHALFGDASASVLMSNEEPGKGVQLLRSRTEQLYDTYDLMTWDVLSDGFRMTLSPYVPFIIAENIEGFMERLLEPERISVSDVKHWIIHPGGPKIIEFITEKLRLTKDQVAPTHHVLAECGNCSSTTVLLVLEEVLRTRAPKRGEYGVMMAFGPGLTMESMLVQF
jgi:predicted naringenin-chalcone synthase